MLASELSAKNVTRHVNPTSTTCMSRRNFLSPMCGKKGLRMFALKLTDGASSVAEAQLLIAESSAPKNMICAKIGTIGDRMRLGRMSWGSFSRFADTILGSMRLAEGARHISTQRQQ